MSYFVYIIQSGKDNSYYKGFTENPALRLLQHNAGSSAYTSSKVPWRLVYLEIFLDKRSALQREKAIKKYGHEHIMRLILSPKNIADKLSQ